MSDRTLRADCSACCGLCCVAPAFDATQGFAVDKPAHTPCAHLGDSYRCDIHPMRAAQGFSACIGFECFGAGQWVTQALHAGRSWRESPALARRMFEHYSRFRILHELLALLEVLATTHASMQRELEDLRTTVLLACALPDATDEHALRNHVRKTLAELVQRERSVAR